MHINVTEMHEYDFFRLSKCNLCTAVARPGFVPGSRSNAPAHLDSMTHPGGNPGANRRSISHRSYLFNAAFVWELTKTTMRFAPGLPPGRLHQLIHASAARLRISTVFWRVLSRFYWCLISDHFLALATEPFRGTSPMRKRPPP